MINILQGFPAELIVVFVILGIILVCLVLVFLLAKKIRDMVFNKRYDDNNTLKYFYASDFENLEIEPIEFISNKNNLIFIPFYVFLKKFFSNPCRHSIFIILTINLYYKFQKKKQQIMLLLINIIF